MDTATTTDPLADLSSKTDEELKGLESDLVSQFDAADESDDIDAMSALADQIDAVRAEIERRGGDQESPAEDATEAPGAEEDEMSNPVTAAASDEEQKDAPVEDEATKTEDAATESEESDDTKPKTAAEKRAEEGAEQTAATDPEDLGTRAPNPEEHDVIVEGTDAPVSSTDSTPEATTAGGDNKEDNVDIPEDRQPVAVVASSNEIVAGTDIPGYAAGIPFKNRMDVAEAMVRRLDTVARATSGDGTQHSVATIMASAPPERTLDPNDIEGNIAKIEDVTRKEAITAAGGYCAPLETRYDIFGTGTTDRPVRDALAGFQARRGGIRYTAAPKITDFAGASGIWTAANDANPTSPTTKPCLTVQCAPEVTAMVDAVTLCLQFGNLMTRAFPELVDRNNQLALVAHARFAERNLLNKLTALSTSVTSGFKLGVARDFLNAVGRAATAYRHRYRMEPTQSLRILVPIWVRDAVREDLAMQMPGDDALEAADNVIDRYLAARNVNASWHLDAPGFPDEVEGSTLDDFPASFDWYIYAEGAFIFLDGGTLDLGIVRDADLVGTNDYKTFTESFEGVARIGAESVRVTTTTKPAGATAGSVDTTV